MIYTVDSTGLVTIIAHSGRGRRLRLQPRKDRGACGYHTTAPQPEPLHNHQNYQNRQEPHMLFVFIPLAMAFLFGAIAFVQEIPFLYGVSVFFSAISIFFSRLELTSLDDCPKRQASDCRIEREDA